MTSIASRVPWLAVAAALAATAPAGCGPALSPPRASPTAREAPVPSVPPVDATTIDRKLLFGYQGWFACPEDGSPLDRWEHWFRPGAAASAATVRVDMWPDVSELAADERCPTPLTLPDGRHAEVYSAFRAATVARHFQWMRDYDLPGVFLQRFTVRLDDDAVRGFRDGVARNVRAASETHGRVFAVMYDISGHRGGSLVEDIKRDWIYLVDTLRLTESGRYLRHGGRPLLAIWGFGFTDRPATPGQAAGLIDFFRNHPEPRYRATLFGGIPAFWRTLTRDSQSDPAWASVYRAFDIVSPWTVGRFGDEEGIARFYASQVAGDLDETRRLAIEYMPVVFPGFSWHNLNQEARPNQIPRRGGRFLWWQIEHALAAGSTMLYGAMFDEVDEGTAMFKTASTPRDAPTDRPMVTLDEDGVAVPNDWYLRLAREAQLRLDKVPRPRRRRPNAPDGETSPAEPRRSRTRASAAGTGAGAGRGDGGVTPTWPSLP